MIIQRKYNAFYQFYGPASCAWEYLQDEIWPTAKNPEHFQKRYMIRLQRVFSNSISKQLLHIKMHHK